MRKRKAPHKGKFPTTRTEEQELERVRVRRGHGDRVIELVVDVVNVLVALWSESRERRENEDEYGEW